MKIDAAIQEAMNEVLAGATDQTDEFKRHLQRLVENVVTGNFLDSDVRHVMNEIRVDVDSEE
jgi:hypothetical protein